MPDTTDPDIEAARAHLDAARTFLIEAESPEDEQNVEELAALALAHAEVAKLALLIRSEERQEANFAKALQALDDEAFLAVAVARLPGYSAVPAWGWVEMAVRGDEDHRFWAYAQSWLSRWLAGAEEEALSAWAEQATANVWECAGVWLLGWADLARFRDALRQLYTTEYLTEA